MSDNRDAKQSNRTSAPNRRDLLRLGGAAAVGLAAGAFPLGWARAADEKPDDAKVEVAKPKKVLFYTRSQGFQHDVVKRNKPDQLSFAEKLVTEWGKKHGFDVTATKDGGVFTPDGLAAYDAFLFYTTGNLEDEKAADNSPPMPKGGKQTLIDAVSGGKGFMGLHCASDTFHSHGNEIDPYIKMLGGEFRTHGAQQSAKIKAIDKQFAKIGVDDFEKVEEWYQLVNFNPDMHVVLLQDPRTMKEAGYRVLQPYPETWARMQDKGRVFYSSMGHREDVWQSDEFHKVFLGGLSWVLRNVDADTKPNFREVVEAATQPAEK